LDVSKIERATIVRDFREQTSMPPRKKGARRKRGGGASTVRVTKGRVAIKVGGYPGTQKLAPSVLIRKIAKKHIRKAASLVLRGTKKKTIRRKKGRKRKGARKGKKRRVGKRKSTRRRKA
jgi:hypothetical protein